MIKFVLCFLLIVECPFIGTVGRPQEKRNRQSLRASARNTATLRIDLFLFLDSNLSHLKKIFKFGRK